MTDVKSIKQNTEKLIEKVAKNETRANKYIILQIQKALSYYSRVIEQHKTEEISETEKDHVNALIKTALKCLHDVTLSEENLTVHDIKPRNFWQLAVQQTVEFIKKNNDKIKRRNLNPNDYETLLKTAKSYAQQLETLEENEQISNTKEKLSIFFLELFICSPTGNALKKSTSSHAVGMRSKNCENVEEVTKQFHEVSCRHQDTNNINDGVNLLEPDCTENKHQIYEISRRSTCDEAVDSEEVSPNHKAMWTDDFVEDAERSADFVNDSSFETSEEETESIEIDKKEKEPSSNDYNFQEEIENKKGSVSAIKNRIRTSQSTLQKNSSISKSETAHREQINTPLNLLSSHDERNKNPPRPSPKPDRRDNEMKKADLRNIESYLQKFELEVQKVNYPPCCKKYINLHHEIKKLLEETETIHIEDGESKYIIMEKIRTLLENLEHKALRNQECWKLLNHIANEIESVKGSDLLTVDKLEKLRECKNLINSELRSDLDEEMLCEKNLLISGIEALENDYNKNEYFENDAFYASRRVKSKR